MPWQLHIAIVFCLKADEVEGDNNDFSSVSEPGATECGPTAPSNEPGVRSNACSTLRDELQPFL
jgi:hypothetical protein